MTEKPGGDIQDGSDGVKIYSSNENRVKFLGDVLANDASRSIFLLPAQGELPASRIADKTGMSLALVTHHLEKMQNAGVVQVSRVSKNIKNRDMKHYRAVLAILIIPEESHARARGSRALALSLRRILRFSSIGIAGLSSWLAAKYAGFTDVARQQITEPGTAPTAPELPAPTAPELPAPTAPELPASTAPELPASTALDPLASITSEPLAPIVVGLGIVILGLVIERVLVYIKK